MRRDVQPVVDTSDLEPERYEMREAPHYHFDLDRRDVLKVLGGGVVVCLVAGSARGQQRGRGGGGNRPTQIGGYLHIAENGQITLYCGKTEVGQNVRTSVTQAAAEELRINPAAIRTVLADTDLVPDDGGTSGSRSTPSTIPQIRRVAAAARELLLDLAAQQMVANRAGLELAEGRVTQKATGRTLTFGDLTRGQKLTKEVSASATPTPVNQWKVLGTSVPKVGAHEIVTGAHQFASDIRLPGMLFGKVLRGPALDAKLVSVDLSGAKSLPGVVAVHDGNFVGVAAPTTYEAEQALARIKAEWSKSTMSSSSDTIFNDLKKIARGGEGADKALDAALDEAKHKLEATYTICYIAHAPLEPRTAVAQWQDGKLTVWTGTQQPFGVRGNLAQAFNLPPDRVRVIVPDTGAGYGGKHTVDTTIEAARLAKAAGKPVKIVWTREEEFTWAYFRPVGVIEVRAGADEDGRLTAWDFHNYNSGQSAVRSLYECGQQRAAFHQASSPLRQGSYRALAATANHFARESHLTELAHLAKIDPLEFRLKNLKDERLRAVLLAAAERFGWGKVEPAEHHGFGIAGGSEKGSYVATCAEVAADPATGKIRVVRAVTAFECGKVLNPDHLQNQIEGAVVQGLGGALFEAIEFGDGKIKNAAFSAYRVPRFADTPQLETVLLDRPDLAPIGAGETPIVGIAPAVAAAIFHATGTRPRSLPMSASGVQV
jgi:isoquinoline 1-oxidoreductase